MEEIIAYRQQLLNDLRNVANEVFQLVLAIPPNDWYISSGLEAYTPHYTLAHLRELEVQVFALQLRRFLLEGTLQLPLFDDVSWMAEHYDPSETAQAILEEFTRLRNQEVLWLEDLSPESWNRSARHPWWGVRTLQWWVELQLEYSHQHLRELLAFLSV
jgi:hypothetical protein